MKRPKGIARWMTGGLIVAASAGAYFWLRRPEPVAWRTARVEAGEIRQRIQATGTLNALIEVSVGTQVSGVVTDLYADFNSVVKKGQLLARIDPTLMQTQLSDARALLDGAEGTYENAQTDLARYRALAEAQLVSTSDLNVKETAFRTARASLESARASLSKARTNLGYCTVTAPVDGVVVSRAVNVGQTVAASLSTPNLFTVAQDLSRMKLEAAIDEADIGQVRVGQLATFTVDSYPDRTFQARVSEIQLSPTVSSNVVTYNVVFAVANTPRGTGSDGRGDGDVDQTALYIPKGSSVYQGDLALFPGMTANVNLIVNQKVDILKVPNAALRFNPGSAVAGAGVGGGGSASNRIWLLENGICRPVEVQVGLSDGQFTEVSGPGLRQGLTVVTGTGSVKKTETALTLMGGPAGGAPPPPN